MTRGKMLQTMPVALLVMICKCFVLRPECYMSEA